MKNTLAILLLTISSTAFADDVTVACSNGKTYTGTSAVNVINKVTAGKNYGSVTTSVNGQVTGLKITAVKGKTKTTCTLN